MADDRQAGRARRQEALGQIIAAARSLKGWTAAQLAKESSVDLSTISRVESGQKMPALDTLYPMAEALGISLDEICVSLGLSRRRRNLRQTSKAVSLKRIQVTRLRAIKTSIEALIREIERVSS